MLATDNLFQVDETREKLPKLSSFTGAFNIQYIHVHSNGDVYVKNLPCDSGQKKVNIRLLNRRMGDRVANFENTVFDQEE